MNIPQHVLIFGLRLYQAVISPVLAAAMGPPGRCRFTPSCSQYARQAIARHGAVVGGGLAVRRLCRCHPWGQWGDDPPPAGPIKVKLDLAKLRKRKICHGS
ncbi:MAG: membrane protein insertion efficiency factor YidD [Verrucomicrobiota bacterium]|jgi:putative membrane protein insertion efficiency factor